MLTRIWIFLTMIYFCRNEKIPIYCSTLFFKIYLILVLVLPITAFIKGFLLIHSEFIT